MIRRARADRAALITHTESATVERRDHRGLAGDPTTSDASAASEAATYAVGFFAAQLLLFVAGVVQKRLLGPGATGAWTLLGTFWSFFALAALGATAGMGRELPAYRGMRDLKRARVAANTGGSFGVASFAVAGLVVAAVGLLATSWSPYLRWGLVLLGLTAPLRALVDIHTDILRLTRRFRILAVSLVLNALLVLTLQSAFVAVLGFWGMFVGLVVVSLASLGLWTKLGLTGFRRPAFRWQIDLSMLRHLALVGIPVTAYSNLWVLFTSIDTLLVATFLDIKSVGYYSVAVSVNSYVLFLPRIVGGALFPRMQERFSAQNSVRAIRHYAVDVPRVLAYLLVPLLLAAAFFLLPVLVRQAMPSFTPGIRAVQVIVAGSFFLSLADMPIEFMITAGRRWRITGLMVAALAVNAAANAIALGVFHAGLVGAAAATGGSYFLLFATTTYMAVATADTHGAAVSQMLRLIMAGVWTIGVLWGTEVLFGPGGGSLAHELTRAFLKLVIALVALSPLVVLGEIRYRPLAMLLRMARGVFGHLRGG